MRIFPIFGQHLWNHSNYLIQSPEILVENNFPTMIAMGSHHPPEKNYYDSHGLYITILSVKRRSVI